MAARTKAAKPAGIPQFAWHQVRPAAIVLVSGTQGLLADRATRLLREGLTSHDASLEVSDIDAQTYAPGELVTLASPSLFAEPRLIRVTGVEKCTDAFIADALDYLAAPADDTVVVMRHAGGVRGKKLLDAIRSSSSHAVEVVCAELKRDSDKFDFAKAEFRTANKKVTPGALRALTDAFGDDLAELAAACQQLIADVSAEITESTVNTYYSGRVEASAFSVADAAIAGQHGDALIAMRHALASGADPVPMVAAFATKLRAMAKVSGFTGGAGQAAAQLGLAPWQVDRARRELRGWSDAGLGVCIQQVAATDASVKGAGRDPVFALETMIGVVAGRGRTQ